MKKLFTLCVFSVLMLVLIGCSEEQIVTYTITFDTQGGSELAPITINQGEDVTLDVPTKDGFEFIDWFKDANYQTPWDNVIDGDLTLYAKWEALPPTSFEVSFNSHGGTMVPTLTVEPNQLITQIPQVSQEGKVFAGWYLDEAYTELFDFGFNKVNENMTLHAKWKNPTNYNETFKVLSIGNSFSEDAHRYLYEIAKSYGIPEENIVIGNMYIGGAELQQHADNILTNLPSYEYQKFTSPEVVKRSERLGNAIKDEDWDVITIQQASHYSGVQSYYQNYVRRIVTWIDEQATNPNVTIGWHLTWAYQQNSSHSGFVWYGHNQMTMYNQIISAYNTKVKPVTVINLTIPSGTAIQNARTSYLGDTLTRDGYHLSDPLGRYIAGLMFFKAITGFDVTPSTIPYKPEGVTEALQLLAMDAVNKAYQNPFEITESAYKEN